MMKRHQNRSILGITLILGLLLLMLTPLTVLGKPNDPGGNNRNNGSSGGGVSDCGRGNNMNNNGNDSHEKALKCATEAATKTPATKTATTPATTAVGTPTSTVTATVTGTPTSSATATAEPRACHRDDEGDNSQGDNNNQGDDNEGTPCPTATATVITTATTTVTATATPDLTNLINALINLNTVLGTNQVGVLAVGDSLANLPALNNALAGSNVIGDNALLNRDNNLQRILNGTADDENEALNAAQIGALNAFLTTNGISVNRVLGIVTLSNGGIVVLV